MPEEIKTETQRERFDNLQGKINRRFVYTGNKIQNPNGTGELDESVLDEVTVNFISEEGHITIGLGKDESKDDAIIVTALAKYDEILYNKANPPKPSYIELRQKEYLAQGATIDKMIVALWEKVVENRNQSANDLQTIREQIKTKFPKLR